MDSPFEHLRVPQSSVISKELCLMRRVPETTHEVDLVRYEELLRRGDHPNLVLATAAPACGPSAYRGGNESTRLRGAGDDGSSADGGGGDGSRGVDGGGGGDNGGGGGGAAPPKTPPSKDKPGLAVTPSSTQQ